VGILTLLAVKSHSAVQHNNVVKSKRLILPDEGRFYNRPRDSVIQLTGEQIQFTEICSMSTKSSEATTERQKQNFIEKLAEVLTKSKENKEKQPSSKGGKPG